jgi:hypothetical protein
MADEKRPKVSGSYLEYLDKPLVREGDTICYGDMNEKCILILEIMCRFCRRMHPFWIKHIDCFR